MHTKTYQTFHSGSHTRHINPIHKKIGRWGFSGLTENHTIGFCLFLTRGNTLTWSLRLPTSVLMHENIAQPYSRQAGEMVLLYGPIAGSSNMLDNTSRTTTRVHNTTLCNSRVVPATAHAVLK
jgi:hypothetical protein